MNSDALHTSPVPIQLSYYKYDLDKNNNKTRQCCARAGIFCVVNFAVNEKLIRGYEV